MSVFFSKKISASLTHWSVKVRIHVVDRLGLGSGPYIVGPLGSGMRVSASFQIIPRGSVRVRDRVRTQRVGASF